MKNFLYGIITSVIKSVIIFIILFFLLISLHSGKFPPSLNLAKKYINDLTQVKEKYSSLLNKSENYLNKNLTNGLDTDLSADADKNMAMDELPSRIKMKSMDSAAVDAAELAVLNAQINQLRLQLGRIEAQNKIILDSLRK